MAKCNRPFADEGILRGSQPGRPGRESDLTTTGKCSSSLLQLTIETFQRVVGKKGGELNHFHIIEVSVGWVRGKKVSENIDHP